MLWRNVCLNVFFNIRCCRVVSWVVLGRSWLLLWCSWVAFGCFWDALGSLLGRFWSLLGEFSGMLGALGSSWGALGALLGDFVLIFFCIGVSLAPFGRFGVGFLVYFRSIFNFFVWFFVYSLIFFCIWSDRDNSMKTSKKPRKNNGFSMILPSGRFQRYRTKQQTEIKFCEEIFVWM